MVFYLSYVFLINLIFRINSYLKKNYLEFLAISIIILVSGLRYNVGYDYDNYVWIYKNYNIINLEPGFNLIVKFLNYLNLTYQSLFFIFSLLTIFFIYKGIKQYSYNPRISMIIYILIPGLYLNSFSIIRQSLAIAILFYSYKFIINNKYLKYIIFAFIATMVHFTAFFAALIFIFLDLLKKTKINNIIYFFLLITSIFLGRLKVYKFLYFLIPKGYENYLTFTQPASYLKIVVLNLLLILILLNKEKIIKKNLFYGNIINILVFGNIILNFFSSSTPITRFAYYFRIFQIILVPRFIFCFSSERNRKILYFGFVVFYISIFIFTLYQDFNSDLFPKMIPYRSIFHD